MQCISRLVGVDCFHEGVVVYISEKTILFLVSVSSYVYAYMCGYFSDFTCAVFEQPAVYLKYLGG